MRYTYKIILTCSCCEHRGGMCRLDSAVCGLDIHELTSYVLAHSRGVITMFLNYQLSIFTSVSWLEHLHFSRSLVLQHCFFEESL